MEDESSATAATVLVEVTRRYPLHGKTHGVGKVIPVPEAVARNMETARPPFGRRVSDEDPETVVEISATEKAFDLAEEKGLDLTPYAGKGSGPEGRIYKEDVERWLGTTG